MNKYKNGDILWLDFNPTKGHEQRGRRPAVIVSNDSFNQRTGLYWVCPISTNMKDFPTHVLLEGTVTKGKVFCEHLRSLDFSNRNPKKIEECPADILDEIKERLILFFN